MDTSFKKKFKNFIKNLPSNKFVMWLIVWIFHFYILLVYKTSKVIVKGDERKLKEYIKLGKGLVLFTWHGRIFVSPFEIKKTFNKILKKEKKGRRINVISSVHKDGQIASRIMGSFDIDVIYGSTINEKKKSAKNKNSLTSIRNILKNLNSGNICVVTADGPRGPKFKINSKITDLVQKTNTGIAYASLSYKHKKVLKSWDEFNLPAPFNTIIIEYGDLITPQKDDNCEEINKKLEENFNKTMKKNDEELSKK